MLNQIIERSDFSLNYPTQLFLYEEIENKLTRFIIHILLMYN